MGFPPNWKDITQVQNFISQFVRGIIRTTMLTFGSMYCMFRLNRAFGYVVLCVFPLIIAVMAVCMKKAGSLFTKLQEQLDTVNSIMQEEVTGIRVIKACVREVYEQLRFGKANNELMYLAVAAILLAGNVSVSADGTTPESVMAAITYTTQMFNGMLMLVMLFQTITQGIASWKRVRVVYNFIDNAVNHTDENIPLAFLLKKAYINISQKCVPAHFCRKDSGHDTTPKVSQQIDR